MKCDICKMRYNPEKIVPINVSGVDDSGEVVVRPVYTIQFNGRGLNLCQHCLSMMLWVESQRGMWVDGVDTIRFYFDDETPKKSEPEAKPEKDGE